MLYIPRGYVHEALTTDRSSLHLTVGIDTFRWMDLISKALTKIGEQNVSFRKSLPVGFLNDSNIKESLKHQFAQLLEIFSTSPTIDKAIAELSDNFFESMLPLPDGHFLQVSIQQ